MPSGAGTFVAPELPDDLLRARPDATLAPPARNSSRRLSGRGELLAATPSSVSDEQPKPRAFQPGLCAVDEFPAELWARLASRRLRRFSRSSLDYGPIAGLWPLREAIAAHLRETRAARCEAA
jgi:GntR family transcriptional regulator/MocR family aminotransferase